VLRPAGDSYPAWQLAIALGRELGYLIDIKDRAGLDQLILEKSAPAAATSGQPEVTA
jgi:hypothetical protein